MLDVKPALSHLRSKPLPAWFARSPRFSRHSIGQQRLTTRGKNAGHYNMRQRENLVTAAGTAIQHMQKALTEMNIQLANVISDISGTTGMRILRDIVKGERDPHQLSLHKHGRIRASRAEIERSLEGTWKPELLFVLEQNLDLYDTYLKKIADCDRRIDAHFKTMDAQVDATQPVPEPRRMRGPRKHESGFDVRGQLYRITGVDLTQIDGVDVQTAQTVISEVGVDMSRWKSEKRFDRRANFGDGAERQREITAQELGTLLSGIDLSTARRYQRTGAQKHETFLGISHVALGGDLLRVQLVPVP